MIERAAHLSDDECARLERVGDELERTKDLPRLTDAPERAQARITEGRLEDVVCNLADAKNDAMLIVQILCDGILEAERLGLPAQRLIALSLENQRLRSRLAQAAASLEAADDIESARWFFAESER